MGNEAKRTKKEEDFSFQVDLKGIIRLLSENLYSSGDVFLRELLQNAVDAIAARRELEPGFQDGRIRVTYHGQADGQASLVFSDNGIGLTCEEIHTFLSVIGQSSKRGEMERNSFIGQFGIGLLSCFLVTDEIVVRSRSVREEKGFRWLGRSDGTYQVAADAEVLVPGTRIEIKLDKKMARRYHEARAIELLKEYVFLIKVPVEFEGDGVSRRINDGFIPWRQSFCSGEEILQFGELMFGEKFFGVVPILGEGLKGYAFISERQTSAATMGRHKIYLKDMLITEDGKDLIPKWAFFTRCIVNAEHLTPMASREGFAVDHALAKARNDIEKCLFEYFMSLSKFDVNKLKRLTIIHNVAIKSLAVENEQIYKLFFSFLTFVTNIGDLTGFQLLEAAKRFPVYYCAEVDTKSPNRKKRTIHTMYCSMRWREDWSQKKERLLLAEQDDRDWRGQKETPLDSLYWLLCWYVYFKMMDGNGEGSVRLLLGEDTESSRREYSCCEASEYFEQQADLLGAQMDRARKQFVYEGVKRCFEACLKYRSLS